METTKLKISVTEIKNSLGRFKRRLDTAEQNINWKVIKNTWNDILNEKKTRIRNTEIL